MIRRVLRIYRTELVKAVRLKTTFLGPAIVIFIILCTPLIFPIQNDDSSDYSFIAYTIPLSVNVAGHFLILLYVTSLIASELSTGTACFMLTRPIKRNEWYLAKLLHGASYVLMINLSAVAAASIVVILGGNLTGVHFGGDLLYSNNEMLSALATCLLLTLIPQFTTVAFGLLISATTKSTATAGFAAIGLWLVAEGVMHPLGWSKGLYITYAETPWMVFSDMASAFESTFFPQAYQGVVVSGVYFVVFTTISLRLIERRHMGS